MLACIFAYSGDISPTPACSGVKVKKLKKIQIWQHTVPTAGAGLTYGTDGSSGTIHFSTALLFIIGTLAPLSILAIWVLRRMRKRPSGPGNDPEHQVGEHSPAAYPLRLVSPPSPPPPPLPLPSPSGPRSAITPPPPARQNGRNKQLPKTKTSYTSSLTSIDASSTAPAKTGEAEIPYLPIFTGLKNKHEETNRIEAERGEGGPSYPPIPVFARLKNKHEGTNRMEQEEENGDPLLRQRWA